MFSGCGSDPQHREVLVNKTVKVFSEDYHEQAENYTFKWKPPIGPNDEIITFYLKNDMLIFTPETVGNYKVNLSIEDISEEVVANKIYYFKAIPETSEVAIIESTIETPPPALSSITKKQTAKKPKSKPAKKQDPRKSSKRKKQPNTPKITDTEYAIQISAWPSLAEARTHQLKLIDEGFDAYTQRFYLQKKDEVWYRVRVGNFSNMAKAFKIKKQIESFIGITTWLDVVSTK